MVLVAGRNSPLLVVVRNEQRIALRPTTTPPDRIHGFKSAVQFNNTVVGDAVGSLTSEVTRKRWPSLVAA